MRFTKKKRVAGFLIEKDDSNNVKQMTTMMNDLVMPKLEPIRLSSNEIKKKFKI